jgi:DNA (cytosine-5)-methyltransferase 1
MNTEEKISIDEFDGKRFQIRLIEPQDDKKAILTHYLHNIDNGVSMHFKKDALKILKEYVEYKKQNENFSLATDNALQQLLFEAKNVPFSSPENYNFKFIDLFAGIGGFRLALQNIGGKCVFTSEWNIEAKKTYRENFGEVPFGDITKEYNKNYIPEKFDILCAGFPCQAFSIAGYQKGFADTRGTLFFDIEQIVKKHKPKVVFLENVKNLVSHDNGNTFKTIIETLEQKLGYKTFAKVLNSSTHANVPQNRERIFIVAFDPNQVKNYAKFEFPNPIKLTKTIHDIIDKEKQDDIFYYKKDHQYYPELSKTMLSKDTVYQWRRVYARENKSNLCPTLTANMGSGGHNVPLILDDFGIRKLTPKECFAFQGYPMDKYILPPVANSKLYMQAGNSVTTPLIERISNEIIKVL